MRLARACRTDVEIACDRDRILQVFGNLVGNANKFCRAGDTITIACDLADDHVRFSVADTGPGIPSDAIPQLFKAYWSAPQHAKRSTGVGLSIAGGIVEAHGGTISVDSRIGDGATFTFVIPTAAHVKTDG